MTRHFCLSILNLFIIIAIACSVSCNRPVNSNQPTPTLSGPPRTMFPMPPMTAAKDYAEMGWVSLPNGSADTSFKRSKVSDYKGKVLVLDLYATWCVPCRFSIPRLIDLQNRYKDQGLTVIGLNVGGADDRVKVPEFAKEFGIQYSLGFPDRALSDALLSDDQSIPQTFVFDREGSLVKRFVGYDDQTTGRMLEEVVQTETSKALIK